MKQLTLLASLLLCSLYASAQAPDFAWAKQSLGNFPDAGEIGRDIALDNQGNSYVLGGSEGNITFGSTTLTSGTFLTKYDASGNVLWAKKAGGGSLAVDGIGNSYISGSFQGSVTFGSTVLTSSGSNDVFIAKYDASGNVVWAKQTGGTGYETANSIAIDGSGNSYITGYFQGSATFGNTTLTSSACNEVFIAKFDASGNVLWAKQSVGFSCPILSKSIAVDASGNSYITGGFQGSATFGNTTLTSINTSGFFDDLHDVFIVKYDASGNVVWAKRAGGTGDDFAYSIAVDGSGNSYITAGFQDGAIFGNTTLTNNGSFEAFLAKYDASGNVVWAKQAGGSGADNSIAIDGSGNSYISGNFQGSATFGSTTLSSSGSYDVYISKFDASGNVVWAKKAGGTGDDVANSIAVDGIGNSYITGYFQNSATFGGTTLTSSGYLDVFIAKYDASGNVSWATNPVGITANVISQDVVVDAAGNSYITGYFKGSATFDNTTLTTSGSYEVFIAKYDASGNVVWAKKAGGTGDDFATSIAVDGIGNSYVTGYFQGSATFGGTVLTSSGSYDIFITKFDASGNIVWAKKAGGTGDDSANSIAVDGSGNSYVAGSFQGSTTFGGTVLTSSGSYDIFITKFDASGNIVWAKKAGGTGDDRANSIAVDGSGNSYVAGSFQGSVTFGNNTLISSEGSETFIAKFDASGNVVWAKQAARTGSIAVDVTGNSYITGSFQGSVTFGSTVLTSSGSNDVFIAKLDASGNVVWAKKAGGTGDETANSIAIDGSGNSYIAGNFQVNVPLGSTVLTSNGSVDVFAAKFDASGIVVWAKQAGGTGFDRVNSIAVDGSGNSFITGGFSYIATFGSVTLTSSGSDAFIAKINNETVNPVQFSLNVTISGSGSVTKSPSQTTYTSGTSVQLTATPEAGYQFSGWSGDVSGSTNPLTVLMNGNKNITATFTQVTTQFSLNVTVNGSGSVSKSPNLASYLSGTSVQLTATAASGFKFDGWSGNATGTANPLTVLMNGNKNITATFTALPNGVTGFNLINSTTDQPIQQLVSGAVLNLATLPSRRLNIQALTNPSIVGSVVFNLSGQQSKTRSDDSGPHYSLQGDKNGNYSNWTPPVGSYTLTARTYSGSNGSGTPGGQQTITFTVIDQVNPPIMYSLNTTIVGNGSVTRNPNQTSYASGSTVTLTATPAVGYQFSGWSGDATGTTNPLTVTMNSNKNITATFTQVTTQYNLNVSVNGSGSVAKNPDQATYLTGTSVQLTALPLAGFQFSGWSGDASGTTNPLTVVMNSNKNITATFTAIPTTGVTGFNLINASADNVIRPLVSGDVINLATLPTRKLNVQALTNPTIVGSVAFNLSGQQTKVRSDESGPTYSLFGDSNGDYSSWTPTVGSYTLSARTYTGPNGSGTPSALNTISFTVIDQANATRLAGTGSDSGSALEPIAVTAYPDPFNDVLLLKKNGSVALEKATIILTTIMGKTVYQKDVKVDGNRQVIELNGLSKLPKGVYLLQLQSNEKPVVLKVLKE